MEKNAMYECKRMKNITLLCVKITILKIKDCEGCVLNRNAILIPIYKTLLY